MTDAERKEALGDLTEQYSDNERTIAALRSRIKNQADTLHALVLGVHEYLHTRKPAAALDHFRLGPPDLPQIPKDIADLEEALKSKASMESELNRAGLSNLIRPL